MKNTSIFISAYLAVVSARRLSSSSSSSSRKASEEGVTTAYFTRHAERVNLLVETGPSDTAYDVSFPDEDGGAVYTAPRKDGANVTTPVGKTFDEACGAEFCTAQLSDLGLLRADLLADYFDGISFDEVYATNKHRTYQTVAPTAERQGRSIVQLPNGFNGDLDPESEDPTICPTINALLSAPLGSTLLVAGHSATLYQILGDKGEEGFEECSGLKIDLTNEEQFPRDSVGRFPRSQYGDVWKVEIDSSGTSRLISRVNLQPTNLQEVVSVPSPSSSSSICAIMIAAHAVTTAVVLALVL